MAAVVYMEDVARAAGVHRTTVSLALRNHPKIPEETRARIRAIAERLGYRTNPMVSALMQLKRTAQPLTRTRTLAYLTAHQGRYDWRAKDSGLPDFFPGAAARAEQFGYRLEDYWINEPGMTGSRMAQILQTRDVAGIIVAPLPPTTTTLDLPWENFSAVTMGVTLLNPLLHRIAHNHFHTMRLAISEARGAGFSRIGIYLPRLGYRSVWDQWHGACRSAQSGGDDIVAVYSEPRADPETFLQWYLSARPDVLISGYKAVPEWVAAHRIRAPEDVSLVSLQVEQRDGWLSGVYYDPAATGAEAVDQLLALIHRNELGVPHKAHDFLLHGEWVRGSSMATRCVSPTAR